MKIGRKRTRGVEMATERNSVCVYLRMRARGKSKREGRRKGRNGGWEERREEGKVGGTK